MAITILTPAPATAPYDERVEFDDEGEGGVDLEGDVEMGGAGSGKRRDIVTPGETVTDDPQWMR